MLGMTIGIVREWRERVLEPLTREFETWNLPDFL
jgi:hypothetical protein